MNFEDIAAEIRSVPITYLPALLVVVLEQCRDKKVFVPGGATKVVNRVLGSEA